MSKSGAVRAFYVWEKGNERKGKAIVFTDRPTMSRWEICRDVVGYGSTYFDFRTRRAPELDKYYRGKSLMKFGEDEYDTVAMLNEGWTCSHLSKDCVKCSHKKDCLNVKLGKY